MKKQYFKDFYGCTASITETNDGFRLKIALPNGKMQTDKPYDTEKAARSAMNRSSESWKKIDI